MPFQSDAQRRFMYAKHPKIAARWSKEHLQEEYEDLPEYVKRKRRMGMMGTSESDKEPRHG
jgi:hypothetical protein